MMLNSHLSKDFSSYSGVWCAYRHKDGASLMALTGFDVGSFVCMILCCSPATPLGLSAWMWQRSWAIFRLPPHSLDWHRSLSEDPTQNVHGSIDYFSPLPALEKWISLLFIVQWYLYVRCLRYHSIFCKTMMLLAIVLSELMIFAVQNQNSNDP